MFIRAIGTFWGRLPAVPEMQAEIRRQQSKSARKRLGQLALANMGCASGTAFVLWDTGQSGFLAAWWFALLATCFLRFRNARAADDDATPDTVTRVLRRHTLLSAVTGLLWALSVAWLFDTATLEQHFLLAIVAGGLIAGSAATGASLPLSAVGFILPLSSSVILHFLARGTETYITAAVLMAVFTLAMLMTSRQSFRAFLDSVLARSRNARLVRELDAARRDLLDAIDCAPEAFALFDAADRLLVSNWKFGNLLRLPPASLQPGTHYEELMRNSLSRLDGGYKILDDDGADLTRLPPQALSKIWKHPSGAWLQTTHRKTHNGGTVCVHVDITALKSQEEALMGAKAEAEAANRMKSQFLTNMSHELRTPLNAIIGFSDLLGAGSFDGFEDEAYKEYVEAISDGGRHLLDLINEILDLSKVEAGHIELCETPVDIGQIAAACTALLQERAAENGSRLINAVPDTLPQIRGDERKLKQVLLNLVSNAVKFTEEGGTVTISAAHCNSGDLVFEVDDTGIGIAAEDIPRVLQPFRQVDGALTRRYAGTGLGLPLAKSFMHLHGGSLTLESQSGVGTRVICRLPAARVLEGCPPPRQFADTA